MPLDLNDRDVHIETIRVPDYARPTNYCSAELEGGIIRALKSWRGEMLRIILWNPLESTLWTARTPVLFPVSIAISLCRMPAEVEGGWYIDFHVGYNEQDTVRYGEFVFFFEEQNDRLFCHNVPDLFFKRI